MEILKFSTKMIDFYLLLVRIVILLFLSLDICFIFAYIFFTLLNFVLIYTASNAINNIWIDIANILISIAQNLSYLIVALSNPGI